MTANALFLLNKEHASETIKESKVKTLESSGGWIFDEKKPTFFKSESRSESQQNEVFNQTEWRSYEPNWQKMLEIKNLSGLC